MKNFLNIFTVDTEAVSNISKSPTDLCKQRYSHLMKTNIFGSTVWDKTKLRNLDSMTANYIDSDITKMRS